MQQVLQLLLREGVPIRQLGLILESLGDVGPKSRDSIVLVEHARQRLARAISTRYRDHEGHLHVVALDAAIEERIRANCESGEEGLRVRIPPRVIEHFCRQIGEQLELLTRKHRPAVVLVSPQIRAAVRQITAARLPHLVVLSFNEITSDTHVDCVAVVSDAVAVAA